ncbi:pentapeptide repeat-containing protein [Olivibacter sp. SDN3]|uniref:pentapeptide repeat-containing protein n=1 Tax=Olivibacter sp. SDN3 TaxID=2764720 RepID=UPI0016512CAA|nr:pentapeptide repeat-containing protein [Olivibacter sp. SDN3]QNL50216.1 pentapeptide repeat-containing protein [Olivibacter sp. SDN3]
MNKYTEQILHESKTFEHINYAEQRLENREFINCTFIRCNFNKSNLGNNDFVDCHFKYCDFSLTILHHTGFSDVVFTECKILGVDFTIVNKFMFSFAFNNCYLDYSLFTASKLKNTNFINCSLKEVDFSEADLSGSTFNNCSLLGAKFFHTILEKADFRTAQHFAIDVETNRMKKAKFSNLSLSGLLYKYQLDISDD